MTTEQDPAAGRKGWTRRRGDLGDHVARTVGTLQARLLGGDPRPEAAAALARLRRGIGRAPGFDYTLDAYLRVPDELLGARPDTDLEASDGEHACHAAVTLYALHQQSRSERMHANGRGLGSAVAALADASGGPDGVRRRFAALGTAATYTEVLYHLRGLVMMLRDHRIPLDYGLLADDLKTIRRPGGREQMQAVWGREYFRGRPQAAEDTDTEPLEETQS